MTDQPNPLRSFQALCELARRQAEAISHDDLAAFAELSRLRDMLAACLPSPRDPGIRVAAVRLLEQVVATDARIEGLLRDGQAAVRAELQQLRQGRRAMHAYVVPAAAESTGGRA